MIIHMHSYCVNYKNVNTEFSYCQQSLILGCCRLIVEYIDSVTNNKSEFIRDWLDKNLIPNTKSLCPSLN